jgi:hypothetical protein
MSAGTESRAAEQRSGETPRERARRLLRSFVALRWVPLAAALLALPLSATALFVSVQQPEVVLILPDQVRVALGRQSGSSYLYFQPAFVSTGRNDRVEVIRDMHLEVTPEGGSAVLFDWSQQIRLVNDLAGGGLRYEYVADAVPLLISPRDAAAPLSLFDGPDGWFFTAGTYTFELTADRVVTGQELRDGFELTLSEADIAFLDEAGTERFLTFPIRD